jgi:hypothetical protein
VAIPRHTIEESGDAIRLVIPSWKSQLTVALMDRKWWAVALTAVVWLLSATLLGTLALVLGLIVWLTGQVPAGGACVVESLILLGLVVGGVAGLAVYDWLWCTTGEDVVEVDGKSLRIVKYVRLGKRRVRVSWPRRYCIQDICSLRAVAGVGWSGRMAMVHRRWGIRREVRFGGSLEAEEAENILDRIKGRFPEFARVGSEPWARER